MANDKSVNPSERNNNLKYICNTQEAKTGECKFEASLGYIMIPISKTNKKKKEEEEEKCLNFEL
jgi:hypothetical protein